VQVSKSSAGVSLSFTEKAVIKRLLSVVSVKPLYKKDDTSCMWLYVPALNSSRANSPHETLHPAA
jgi:hypothetical protein